MGMARVVVVDPSGEPAERGFGIPPRLHATESRVKVVTTASHRPSDCRPAIGGRRLQACRDAFVFGFNRRRSRHPAFRSLPGIGARITPATDKMPIAPETKAQAFRAIDGRPDDCRQTMSIGEGNMNRVRAISVIATAALYMLPALIAWNRGHQNTLAIAVLTAFLGWSALGWIAAPVWAYAAVRRENASA